MRNLLIAASLAALVGCAHAAAPEARFFGVTKAGETASLYTLRGAGGLTLEVSDFGGRLVRCFAPDAEGRMADVTLGWNTVGEYEKYGYSMGTLIGRFANRIRDGRFTLDGKTYQLAINEKTATRNCNLHSGPDGWDVKVWKARAFVERDAEGREIPALELTLVSPDGDMGFPGTVTCTATYRVLPENTWRIDYAATTDKPTVINVTHHTYWNLAGEASGDVLKQWLKVYADGYTRTDAGLIPTKNAPVRGTGMDFTVLRPIGAKAALMKAEKSFEAMDSWYDHNFVLRGTAGELRPAAEMRDPESGRTLEIWTTEPCMQMYGAQNMDGTMPTKTKGKKLVQFAGVALETQHYPDSPNRPDFPTTVLRPGETFRSTTEYRFSASKTHDTVDKILAKMTLAEKLGQLKQGVLYTDEDAERVLPAVARGEYGSFIFNETIGTNTAAGALNRAQIRARLQNAALSSRCKIPLSFADNIIHGWRTNFPIPLGLACAFEPQLFERTAAVGAREGREAGLDWTFGPMCDTARDPRWGRVSETTGEDPWLNGLYAVAAVQGFQGKDPSARDRVAACIKHFAGYSAVTGGRDYRDSDFSEWTLRNIHLAPFKAAVDAGALTLMSGFNSLDGRPVLTSQHLMKDILRGEWGFRGTVVTDYNAVIQTIPWGVAADEAEAARICFNAGNDIEMTSTAYDKLAKDVAEGRIPMRLIDESVRRVLRQKEAVGLLARPGLVPPPNAALRASQDAASAKLAYECALKSAVLVQNRGDLLPLKKNLKVALIGPLAEDNLTMVGCWAGLELAGAHTPKTLAETFRAALGSAGGSLTVVRGCAMNARPPVAKQDDGLPVLDRTALPEDRSFDGASAIAAARAADVVVFAFGEPLDWTGENASRSLLTLTGRQQELFDTVVKAVPGKRVVTIVSSGRPLALPSVWTKSDAVFYAFHGGDGGPQALADLVFGVKSPSGRLTISVPYDVSQVPVFYNASPTGRAHQGHYLDTPEQGAKFTFGHGLTYTKFDYSPVTCEKGVARVTVRNVGSRAGVETVQLYIRQLACAEGARPMRELRGFKKVTLWPGESTEVRFALDAKTLGYTDRTGRFRCDEGAYSVWIAPNARAGEAAQFRYVETRLPVVLTFDDNIDNHLTRIAPELEKRGWRGIFNVITDKVGAPSALSWGDLREMLARGHEIGNHTKSHPHLDKVLAEKGAAALREEIDGATDVIVRETGVKPRYLCLPFSDGFSVVEPFAKASGLEVFRVRREVCGDCTVAGTKTGPAAIIRQRLAGGAKAVDLMTHGVEGRGYHAFKTLGDFQAFLDEVKKLEDDGVIVVTDYKTAQEAVK